MAVPVILMGRSGTGKSTSLRTMPEGEYGLINVIGKPLPFRTKTKGFVSTDYGAIKSTLKKAKSKSIVCDDAGYLITDMFMTRHSSAGAGNGVFSLYNDIGDAFYSLVRFIVTDLPDDMIVYLVMHEDTDDQGRSKIKTIGRLLDEKVTVEGLVSVVIRSTNDDGEYKFHVNGEGICKSPIDMFETETIPNDLKMVDDAIREYWDMAPLSTAESGDA